MAQLVTPQVKTVVNEVKAGWKTSEFWVHLAVQVLTWITVYDANTPASKAAGVGLSVIALLGYTVSRTVVKSSNGSGNTVTTLGAVVQKAEAALTTAENKAADIVAPIVADVTPPTPPEEPQQ